MSCYQYYVKQLKDVNGYLYSIDIINFQYIKCFEKRLGTIKIITICYDVHNFLM